MSQKLRKRIIEEDTEIKLWSSHTNGYPYTHAYRHFITHNDLEFRNMSDQYFTHRQDRSQANVKGEELVERGDSCL